MQDLPKIFEKKAQEFMTASFQETYLRDDELVIPSLRELGDVMDLTVKTYKKSKEESAAHANPDYPLQKSLSVLSEGLAQIEKSAPDASSTSKPLQEFKSFTERFQTVVDNIEKSKVTAPQKDAHSPSSQEDSQSKSISPTARPGNFSGF